MDFISEFRNKDLATKLSLDIFKVSRLLDRDVKLMEVCGTHTMSIARFGLKSMLPENVKLVSGPGCPVCVTPIGYIDAALEILKLPNIILTSFGDMLRVPGRSSSLIKEREKGGDIRIVYSPLDALEIARNNKDKEIVFLGVGFETTVPVIAATILTAKREGIENFSIFASNKTMPEAMKALTRGGKLGIDGYICPAHVSAIIGEDGYKPIVNDEFKAPCVITGFEPLDVLRGIRLLLDQIIDNRAEVENEYNRVVKKEGNRKALALIDEIFTVSDSVWRGIGLIEGSGLKINDKYASWNAAKRFNITMSLTDHENKACQCGEILKGLISPADCKLFGTVCVPDNPIGACMVSSEGSCAAAYKYGSTELCLDDVR